MPRKSRLFRRPPSWTFFFIFLISDTALSHLFLSAEIKIIIGLVGIVLPLLVFFLSYRNPHSGEKPPWLLEFRKYPPAWFWVLPLALAFFFRLLKLTSLSNWPMPDDGLFAFFSSELCQKWDWRFFYSHGQHPALFNWCLGMFFKLMEPSLLSLWLFPALVSVGAALAFFVAGRAIFPKPFALVYSLFLATCFGMSYPGRFCNNWVLALFWEGLALALLALYVKHRKDLLHERLSGALGFCVGMGFFVSIPWGLVALGVTLALFSISIRSKHFYINYLLPVAVFGVFFLFLFFRDTHGEHLSQTWLLRDGVGAEFLTHAISCLAAYFFGTQTPFVYGPVWGGILNPLLGSLFFLGLAECLRFRRLPLVRWVLFCLVLLILPGLAAKGFDFFRIAPAVPFSLFFAAAGFLSLARPPLSFMKGILLLIILGSSFLLDFHHWNGPYHTVWGTPNPQWRFLKSAELFKSYQVLEKTRREWGPGMVLSELRVNPTDQTLTIATYPFDTARNPKYAFEDSRWTAVIVNADAKGFLARKFPTGRWYWLGKEYIWNQFLMLAVVPVDGANREIFRVWYGFNQALQPVTSQNLHHLFGAPQERVVELLLQSEALAKGDPFLQSCLWEKVAFHRMVGKDDAGALEAVRRALEGGLPLAHLFNLEGVLLDRLGRKEEASAAFQRAVHSKLNFSPAEENFKSLREPAEP